MFVYDRNIFSTIPLLAHIRQNNHCSLSPYRPTDRQIDKIHTDFYYICIIYGRIPQYTLTNSQAHAHFIEKPISHLSSYQPHLHNGYVNHISVLHCLNTYRIYDIKATTNQKNLDGLLSIVIKYQKTMTLQNKRNCSPIRHSCLRRHSP